MRTWPCSRSPAEAASSGICPSPPRSPLPVSPVTSRRGQLCNHVKHSRLQGLQKRPISFDLPGSSEACQSLPRNSHASAIQAFQTRHPDSSARTPPTRLSAPPPSPARAFCKAERGKCAQPAPWTRGPQLPAALAPRRRTELNVPAAGKVCHWGTRRSLGSHGTCSSAACGPGILGCWRLRRALGPREKGWGKRQLRLAE